MSFRPRQRRWLGLLGLLVAPTAACARGAESTPIVVSDAGTSSSTNGTFAADAAVPKAPPVPCGEATQQIYVVGSDKSFYRFYPLTLTFERVGTLGCPTSADTFSMAIDRFGVAWVEYTDGRLYAVDTKDASCTPTPFKPRQTGFDQFGMGFAKNSDEPLGDETLFVAGDGLASVDTTTFDLKFLGSLTFGRTELTAMGSTLYAFGVASGVVARLNKSTGATEATFRTSAIDESAAFAFAHWGGEFWIFTGRGTSIVTQYSPTTDVSTVVVPNTGMEIVGAGSSSCAPTQLPK